MEYRRLGASGLRVSEIGLGSHLTFGTRLDLDATRRCVARAIDLGINFFDTADGYGDGEAERLLGRVLSEHRREGWIVATKCFFPRSGHPTDRGLSRKHVVESVNRSLRRLRVDHVDLMQCHRFDPDTPVEETVSTMEDLVRQGKILYWGVGRCDEGQLDEVLDAARRRRARLPVAHQTLYNLLHREVETALLSVAHRAGLGTIAHSPLAAGVLTGKYGRGEPPAGSRGADHELASTVYDLTPEAVARAGRFERVAAEHGLTAAQLALAFCLRRPEVATAVVGATDPGQLVDCAAASGVDVDPAAWQALDAGGGDG